MPSHQLRVEFTDGQSRLLDVKPYLSYPVFHPLYNPAVFNQVQADHGTVSWPGGIDLDPDSVFLESVPTEEGSARRSLANAA
jgi:hypothetical protein